jgi:hypothetical protein
MTQDEKKIAQIMSLLKCSRDEALDVIESDKRIDRGEKLFELTPDQKQAAKEARQAPRTPTVYKFTQRERKAKPEKAQICTAMINGLAEMGIADLKVVNEEREFTFSLNGVKYKVTLACPRK